MRAFPASVAVVTDDVVAPATLPPRAVPAVERVPGSHGLVMLVLCRDLAAAMALIRRVEGHGRHARLLTDEAAARQFAEDIVSKRTSWADEEG